MAHFKKDFHHNKISGSGVFSHVFATGRQMDDPNDDDNDDDEGNESRSQKGCVFGHSFIFEGHFRNNEISGSGIFSLVAGHQTNVTTNTTNTTTDSCNTYYHPSTLTGVDIFLGWMNEMMESRTSLCLLCFLLAVMFF